MHKLLYRNCPSFQGNKTTYYVTTNGMYSTHPFMGMKQMTFVQRLQAQASLYHTRISQSAWVKFRTLHNFPWREIQIIFWEDEGQIRSKGQRQEHIFIRDRTTLYSLRNGRTSPIPHWANQKMMTCEHQRLNHSCVERLSRLASGSRLNSISDRKLGQHSSCNDHRGRQSSTKVQGSTTYSWKTK